MTKDQSPKPPAPPAAGAVAPSLTDQEEARRDKLQKLAALGVDIFPVRAERTHSVYEVVRDLSGMSKEDLDAKAITVAVPGRIMSIRKMGRATFFHISDGRKRLQAYIREDVAGPKAYEVFGLLDIGDLVSVKGKLFKTKTGELTVLAESVTFLAKCLHPLPEKWHGLQDIELRVRKRYLDLIMNPEVGEVFRVRSAIVARIRQYFDSRGYMEVETPMMQVLPGGAVARPFKTFHNALGLDLYLRIAPELYLKRLVVGGFEKVYEINRNFRNEGIDAEHNPEFTMLEWYEAYADYRVMMDMTEDLFADLAMNILGKEEVPYGEAVISFRRPFKRIKYIDAVREMSGLSPERLADPKGLIEFASNLTPDKPPVSYAKALDVVFDKQVKHKLVQPTFVTNTPKELSPLAKPSKENPDETERFELIVAGMELANAFSELADPADQKRRFEQQQADRQKGDAEAHPIDEDYVEALEYGLPPTGGEGIGIDRLVMILTDSRSIRDVILFPLLRPR